MTDKCSRCIYSKLVAQTGQQYTVLSHLGDELVRTHDEDILACRFLPPIGGSFPQVNKDSWCGQFDSGKTGRSVTL